jgi:hypothetical protein
MVLADGSDATLASDGSIAHLSVFLATSALAGEFHDQGDAEWIVIRRSVMES